MLRSRIIPCLLIQNGGLVKTIKFSNSKYVGDPLNAVRIFNEKEVDELIIIDIDATKFGTTPNEPLIKKLANECRMPLCYGGGIKNINQIERIISLGVEKVAIGSEAINNIELIKLAAQRIGGQSIVGVIDYRHTGFIKKPEVVTHNATRRTGIKVIQFAKQLQDFGVGEILLNSVDRDGTMMGYDLEVIGKIFNEISVPLTVLGGAGSNEDIRNLITNYPLIGAAVGSFFVFKGKYRAVLINYPNQEIRNIIDPK